MSTTGGIWKALNRGAGIGCDIVQIFVKNNMQWFRRHYTPEEPVQFIAERRKSGLASVFGHTGYLTNLAAHPSPNRDKSLQSLSQEISFATGLGLPFLVMHPGSHLGAGEKEGLRQVVSGLNEVFRETRASPVRIALENTAGQGSCLGHQIAHLGEIYQGADQPERLGVCLDTAHFFQAGYDLRTRAGWNAAIREVESLIGLDQVLAFHLNDSKSELGSRVDRHAGIGEGQIGREAFRHIVNDRRFRAHPACLETSKSEDLHEDIENLAILRSLEA